MSEYVRQLNDESLRIAVQNMSTRVEIVDERPSVDGGFGTMVQWCRYERYLKLAGVRADLLANEIVDRLNELDELREKVKQSQQEILLDALTKLGQEIRV